MSTRSKSETLVKRAQKNDQNAFVELIDQVKDQAYKTAYTYVKNEDDALDIVSESVYKAYRSIVDLQNPQYFTTWFMRIVMNSAVTFLNKQKNISYVEEYPENSLFSQADNSLSAIQNVDLYHAIDRLAPEQRTIIILRFYKDMKIEEIAQFLDIPLSTAKTRLYKTLSALKQDIGEVYDQ